LIPQAPTPARKPFGAVMVLFFMWWSHSSELENWRCRTDKA
jgi:hypothetical protein